MAQSKENLKLLLEFISKLLEQEGNEWFHDELAVLFSKKFKSEKDTGIKLSAVTIKELGSIEKYLDEGLIPIIDYSKISNKRVRFQLERDAIEMGKSRLSNYSGSISFEKFCKYAHFQSEELVNYYFVINSNGDLNSVKQDILDYTKIQKDKIKDNSTISSIPHYMKLWALSNKINIINTYNFTLSDLAKVRNLEIHRDSTSHVDEKLQRFINREDYNQIYEALVHLKEEIIKNVEKK
jgi:hypothetical protein